MNSAISIIIPTLNSEQSLAKTLYPLVDGAVTGLVSEVIIVDGGSTDDTKVLADKAGCKFIECEKGRGLQLHAGALQAKSDWLLFLHSDTVLGMNWDAEINRHISLYAQVDAQKCAYFKFALDTQGFKPRILEILVRLRCKLFSLPYGDQALLISKSYYETLGGFKPIPCLLYTSPSPRDA